MDNVCLDGNQKIPLSAFYPASRRIKPLDPDSLQTTIISMILSISVMDHDGLDGFPSKPLTEIQRTLHPVATAFQNVRHLRHDQHPLDKGRSIVL